MKTKRTKTDEGSSSNGRNRYRNGAPQKHKRKGYSTFISDKEVEGSEPHATLHIKTQNPSSLHYPGLKFRNSRRWSDLPRKREVFQIPYVSVSGKFSLQPLYSWYCAPSQFVSSVAATVYSRLLKLLSRRFCFSFKRMRKYREVTLKISLLYTMLHDDSIIDRFLGILGNPSNQKAAINYCHFCYCRLDDTQRFVFTQACSQASWLELQAERPSAKSSNKVGGYVSTRKSRDQITPSNIDFSLFIKDCTNLFFTERIRSKSSTLVTPCLSEGSLDLYSFGSELSILSDDDS